MSHQQVLATFLIQPLSATCCHLGYAIQCKEILQGHMHPDQQLWAVYQLTGSFVAAAIITMPQCLRDQTFMPFFQHLQAYVEVTPFATEEGEHTF